MRPRPRRGGLYPFRPGFIASLPHGPAPSKHGATRIVGLWQTAQSRPTVAFFRAVPSNHIPVPNSDMVGWEVFNQAGEFKVVDFPSPSYSPRAGWHPRP